jgi:hypothetical protein
MLLPLKADHAHLFLYFFEPLEDPLELQPGDDEELASDVRLRRRISDVPLILHENIRIAEIGALDVQVEGDEDWLAEMVFVQVVVEFDTTLENEEHFFSIVTLTIELVFCVDLHRFEQG